MSRHFLTLTRSNRSLAKAWIDRAPEGWVMEIREEKRSDEQNKALWGLIGQIQKQRPIHNGKRMTPDLWKLTFLQALGMEVEMLPTLDGDGFFPAGTRSSALTVGEFSSLIELMLAWCARSDITIKHFDGEPAQLAKAGIAA